MTPAGRPGRLAWWAAAAAGLLLIGGAATWQLQRSEYFWRNPLEGATVTRLTDFEGGGASRRHFARREVRRFSLRPRWHVGRVGQPGRDRRGPQPHQRQSAGAAESRHSHGRLFSRRVAGHPLESRAEFRQRRSGRCRVGGSDDGRAASALPERHLRARLVARRQTHRVPPAGGRRSPVRHRARREGRAADLCGAARRPQPLSRLVARRRVHLLRPRLAARRKRRLAHSPDRRRARAADLPRLARDLSNLAGQPDAAVPRHRR